TGGSFDTYRFLGVGAANSDNLHSYVAVEAAQTNGPFVHPENLKRYNIFAKPSYDLNPTTTVGLMATSDASQWIGSGQIPSRLLGTPELPTRFDALDASEGGSTQRSSVGLFLQSHPDPLSRFDARVYFIHYKLALFNDFTFFLNDPVNADEIE